MNRFPFPQVSEIPDLTTPYELTESCDPRRYTHGLAQWPGLPVSGLKSAVTAEQKKQIARLLAERAENLKDQAENDAQLNQHKAKRAADDFEREILRRELTAMDFAKFTAASTRLHEIEELGRELAKAILPKAIEAKMAAFVTEAKTAEARLIRHGKALFEDRSEDGIIVRRWTLWTDQILSEVFGEVWFLAHYWSREFAEAKFEQQDALEWLGRIIAD